MVTSPTATDEESSEPSVRTKILTPLLITLSLFACFGCWAYRTTKRSSGSGAENGGGSTCPQARHAPPVARPVGRGEVERGGGAAVAQEGGVISYAHAVAVPAPSDADGSGRVWTVVVAEVVE